MVRSTILTAALGLLCVRLVRGQCAKCTKLSDTNRSKFTNQLLGALDGSESDVEKFIAFEECNTLLTSAAATQISNDACILTFVDTLGTSNKCEANEADAVQCASDLEDTIKDVIDKGCFCVDDLVKNAAAQETSACPNTLITQAIANKEYLTRLTEVCGTCVIQQADDADLEALGFTRDDLEDDLAMDFPCKIGEIDSFSPSPAPDADGPAPEEPEEPEEPVEKEKAPQSPVIVEGPKDNGQVWPTAIKQTVFLALIVVLSLAVY